MQFCQICKYKNNTRKIRAKDFLHTDTKYRLNHCDRIQMGY